MRLRGGSTPNEGYIEIKPPNDAFNLTSNAWGGICDDGFGKPEADVICRMLGYPYGSQKTWKNSGDYSTHGFGHGNKIILDNVKCNGNEKSITQCRHNKWGEENCYDKGTKHEWAGVVCMVPIISYNIILLMLLFLNLSSIYYKKLFLISRIT